MKSALMVVDTIPCINIGDYIQAVAASQFLSKTDTYIERERLSSYRGEPVKMIMNGWYMHQPENWPPSDLINPLFVAFHINSSVKEQMLSDESIAYLKRHEPIGCRDTYTMELLRSKGVDAYFSACLTLTLGQKYRWEGERNGKCCFVDPYIGEVGSMKWLLKSTFYAFCHFKMVYKQAERMYGKRKGMIKRTLKASGFLWINNQIFSREIIENASYSYHEDNDVKSLCPTNAEKIAYAESLIKEYAQASLVVTSRIHCALPCLGLDTPVLYLHTVKLGEVSSCRLAGMMDFFTVINCVGNTLIPQFKFNKKITSSDEFRNKISTKTYIRNLIQTCEHWVSAR